MASNYLQKEVVLPSERVKSVDLHLTKPWILTSLHTGKVCIWDYELQKLVKSIKVHESSPVRTSLFIPGKDWIVTGADDGFIRVYDYETMEMIKEFKAHGDYIRSIVVHPRLPYVVSASDDKLIKLWDWDKDWTCAQVFEGHLHYVMQVTLNPEDPDIFASASLDGTLKVWKIGSPVPEFSLDGHSKGVNCVDFFTAEGDDHHDKLYVISGSDDFSVKIWDYEARKCVGSLEGHTNNVTAVLVIPQIHVILTCSEDQTIRLWSLTDHKLETTLEYGLKRVWTICYSKRSKKLVFGCDDGTILAKINN